MQLISNLRTQIARALRVFTIAEIIQLGFVKKYYVFDYDDDDDYVDLRKLNIGRTIVMLEKLNFSPFTFKQIKLIYINDIYTYKFRS